MPYDTIRRKRDGEALTAESIRTFFGGYLDGAIEDYQMAALLMAIYFQGLTADELAVLVDVMLHSGEVADFPDVPGVKVDKHSTGGVGDKVSLVLAPLVAALGVPVPMMAGRGLGHSGGTIDKLESIPGFRTDLTLNEARAQLQRIGCVLMTQTTEMAPLDRRLYALRDVTGTVESIPLIASSIMSKKLAEGLDALVLDIKLGNGAFLPDFCDAESLAATMIAIGRAHGCEVVALVTAMDRPLGFAVGNALEVEEAVLTLRGEGPADVQEVTLALTAEMLVLGRAAPDLVTARREAAAALADGRALEKMRQIIENQGGNAAILDDPAVLPQAPVRRSVIAAESGCVRSIDARAIGRAAVTLGAGRTRLGGEIRSGVGFHLTAKPGDIVERGERIATVFAMTEDAAAAAVAAMTAAVEFGDGPADPLPLVSHRITSDGTRSFG
jgi:pyrimidine-nucleoside phosphorylase